MRTGLISGFVVQVIVWLVLCLIGWYALGAVFAAPVGWLAGNLMHGIYPGWVDGFEMHGTQIDLLTGLQLPSAQGAESGRVALLTPEADYLTYGFGLPLMIALFLASGRRKVLFKMLLAMALLLPFTVFSVFFSWLKDVAIVAGPAVAGQVNFGELGRNAIALAYQFGTLILPTLAPIAIWLALDYSVLARLVQKQGDIVSKG